MDIVYTDNIAMRENELVRILQGINWQKFHNLCLYIGNEFNEPQWRFLKAIILEKSIETFSNNQLTYVGNESRGCDFIVRSLDNLKIEMKFTNEVLFSGKKLLLREKTKQITLLNSKGTNKHTCLPECYSEYLLVVEMNGAGIISKEKLQNYIINNGDSLTTIIPTNEMNIIFTPKDINITSTENPNVNIKGQILNLINDIIQTM